MARQVLQGTATGGSLADVTASAGGKWTPHPDYIGDLYVSGTTVISGGATEEALYVVGTSSAASSSFQAAVRLSTTFGNPFGVAYSVDTTKFKTFYLARFASSTLLELLRVEGSSTTTLGSATYALATTTLDAIFNGGVDNGIHRISMVAGTQTATITATETSALGAGRVGVYQDGRTGTNTLGPWLVLSTATSTSPNFQWGVNEGTPSLGSLTVAGTGTISGFSGDGAITLSALTVSGAETIGGTIYGTGTPSLILPTASATVVVGYGATGAARLPLLVSSGLGQVSTNNVTLSPLTVSGAGVTMILGTGEALLPLLTGSGSGTVVGGGVGAVELSGLTVEGAGTTAILGTGAPRLFLPRSLGAGFVGFGGAAAIALSALEALGSGYVDISGTGTADLPLLYATGNAIVGDVAVGLVFVMNTQNAAVTEYEGWSFDSFAELDGVMYGLGAAGIVALTGDADDTAKIAASIQTGKSNLGSDSTKRPTDAYASGRFDGQMVLSVTAKVGKKEETYDYDTVEGENEPESRKYDLGRGFESVYVQYTLANRNGCDFELDALTALSQMTGRRV